MEFNVIIPARYDSTRFPGKVLADLNGKPVLQYVYDNAVASGATRVVIATDNELVCNAAEKFSAEVCMTSSDHESGTERLSEAIMAMDLDDEDIVVNLQADEPLLSPNWIRAAAEDLINHETFKVSTLSVPIRSVQELQDPNIVKVVLNKRGIPLYFSRAPIPFARDGDNGAPHDFTIDSSYQRHVGLYVYTCGFLRDYIELPPCPLESIERLEQLRILWNGKRMHVKVLDGSVPPGIDTPEDLQRVATLLKK